MPHVDRNVFITLPLNHYSLTIFGRSMTPKVFLFLDEIFDPLLDVLSFGFGILIFDDIVAALS